MRDAEDFKFNAFGYSLIGESSMAKSYAKVDEKLFIKILNNEIVFVRKIKRRDRVVVIDAGANLGFYAIGYHLCGNTEIHAFEPYPATFKQLKRNVEINHLTNIAIYDFGLFSEETVMRIGSPDAFQFYKLKDKILKYSDKNQAGCKSIYTSDYNAKLVKLYAGDQLQSVQCLDQVDLIKIDVEGAELAVLRGLTNTISKYHPLLRIEFNQNSLRASNTCQDEIINFLLDTGYQQFHVCPLLSNSKWRSLYEVEEFVGAKDILFY